MAGRLFWGVSKYCSLFKKTSALFLEMNENFCGSFNLQKKNCTTETILRTKANDREEDSHDVKEILKWPGTTPEVARFLCREERHALAL